RPYQGRPACSYCSACASYGCRSGARGSVPEALLSRALATGRCALLQPAMVREVTLDSLGRANGCVFLDLEGKEHEVRARVVCISCSAVESARLLLLSNSPRFPLGLCNDHGLVGRNLQFHGTSLGYGIFHHAGLPFGQANPFMGLSLMDHYFLPDGVSDLPK